MYPRNTSIPMGRGVAGEAYPCSAARGCSAVANRSPAHSAGTALPMLRRVGADRDEPRDDGECGGQPERPEHGEGVGDLIPIAIVERDGDTPWPDRRPARERLDLVGQRDGTIVAGHVVIARRNPDHALFW